MKGIEQLASSEAYSTDQFPRKKGKAHHCQDFDTHLHQPC